MKKRRTAMLGKKKLALSAIIIFALIAAGVIFFAKAASWVLSIETENGITNTPAQKIPEGSASGGQAVKFGSASQPDVVLAIGGDIQKPNSDLHYGLETSNLIADVIKPHFVLALGDLQYDSGTLSEFNTYYSQTWGRPGIKSITYPLPGNHEYKTSGSSGYYSYFSAANNSINGKTVSGPAHQGYYAFDINSSWRVYAMNSEANLPAQQTWLAADMAANPRQCSIFAIHAPYWDYSTTHDGEADDTLPLLKTFYDNGGDLQFSGHEHNYQRMKPANPYTNQVDSTAGIRSFVLGMAGTTNLYNTFGATANNSNALIETSNGTNWGVLKLTLKQNGAYDWSFMPVNGGSFSDSGSGTCH